MFREISPLLVWYPPTHSNLVGGSILEFLFDVARSTQSRHGIFAEAEQTQRYSAGPLASLLCGATNLGS